NRIAVVREVRAGAAADFEDAAARAAGDFGADVFCLLVLGPELPVPERGEQLAVRHSSVHFSSTAASAHARDVAPPGCYRHSRLPSILPTNPISGWPSIWRTA